jgi:cobalamin biosynthesis Mg chelatase CobN
MINYFKRYSEGSESVWFYGLGLDVRDGVPVDKSDVKINPFEINFVNDNLLDEGSKAYYKGNDDEDFTEVEYKTEDSLSESFQSAYKVFKDNNYDVDNRIKLFDVSSSNEMVETAQIKVPIPSAWKAKADSIKVLTYTNENDSAKITEVACTADNGYIIFTAPHFSPYALYYTAAEETTTTAASTTAATTTTTAATTATVATTTTNATTTAATTSKAATTTTTESKPVSDGKDVNNGSGTHDNTPDTGVKDFMWIAVPVAVMLMGVGIVVLAMRKRKTLDK